jgi:hypothetical protein
MRRLGVGIAIMHVPHQDAHDSRSSCGTALDVCGISLPPDMPPGIPARWLPRRWQAWHEKDVVDSPQLLK